MSLLGTLLRTPSRPSPSTIAAATACSARTKKCPEVPTREYHKHRLSNGDSISSGGRPRRLGRHGVKAMLSVEDVFIRSLVTAGTCKRCSAIPSSTTPSATWSTYDLQSRQRATRQHPRPPRRAFSTDQPRCQAGAAAQAAKEPEGADVPRKEYEDLVNIYDIRHDKLDHYPLAPRLAITPEQEDLPPHAQRKVLPPIDDEHKHRLKRLRSLLQHNRPGYRAQRIYEAYKSLPTPRVRYLGDGTVNSLLRHFSWVEKRWRHLSRRYFALLEEAVAEGVPVPASAWNTAIAFASSFVDKTTSDDVKAAIETWLRMEREGGVSANRITFNILFDLAVKAGRFALADTIYAEMDRRKMELNRYFRTSKIYYAGRRGDAENVRAAFRELVAAGEIVDTTIMNCVILSLVRCGEPASAEHVMAKMKLLHEQKFGIAALKDWRDIKALGRELDKSARELRKQRDRHLSSFFGTPYFDDSKKEEIQRAAPIAPDEVSYRILIHWHARVSGNLDKIREFLSAIDEGGHRVHHNVFFALFKGFVRHGGYAYTAWNRKSLEGYWREYLSTIAGDAVAAEVAARVKARLKAEKSAPAADYHVHPLEPSDAEMATDYGDDESVGMEDDDDEDTDPPPSHLAPIEFRSGPVMAALAAFYKCAGMKRMLEVWEEAQEAWKDMSEHERARIEVVIAEKRQEAGMYVDR